MRDLELQLARRGHELYVVATFPHTARFLVKREFEGRIIDRTADGRLEVTRVWSASKQKSRHHLGNYLSYNILAFCAAQTNGADYDVILASSGSFFTGVTA